MRNRFGRSIIIIFVIVLLFPLLARDVTTLYIPPFGHTWGIHKGTEGKLRLLLGRDKEFDNPQGIACARLAVWEDPSDDNDDDEITAYGVNSGPGEIIYNKSMTSLGCWGSKGTGERQLLNPHGITASSKGDVLVCDTDNGRIVHLFNDGKQLRFKGIIGEDTLRKPYDIHLTPEGFVFVTDRAANCIYRTDMSGSKFERIGVGYLQGPTGFEATSKEEKWGYVNTEENCLIVIDSLGKRITKMDYTGKIEYRVRASGLGYPYAEFMYIATDYYNNIYVTNKTNCKVHKFSPELEHIVAYGEPGDDDNQFDEPRGIAIYKRFGQIVIAEKKSAQYYWVGTNMPKFSVSFLAQSHQLRVHYFITERSLITLELLDSDKDEIVTLLSKRRKDIGENGQSFELEEELGRRLEPGKYYVKIIAEATYSSKSFYEQEHLQSFTVR